MVDDKDNDTNETNETKNSGTTVVVVLILLLFFAITGSWLYISRNKKKSVSDRSTDQADIKNDSQNVGQGNDDNFLADFKGRRVNAKTLRQSKAKSTQQNTGQFKAHNTRQPVKVSVDDITVNDVIYSKDNPYSNPEDQYLVQAREQLLKKNN